VFDDDAQVEIFMKNDGEFIDNKVSLKNMSEVCELIDLLRSNKILKGLVPLEWIFDRHDMYKHKVGENKPKEYIEINIGSEVGPKIIKIEKGLQRKKGKKIEYLIKEYWDVFDLSYDELKAYKRDSIQHTITLNENVKPLKQNLRRINPKLIPLIQTELEKMLTTKIIAPTQHSYWLANLALVRKKTGETRICVDFMNLNQLPLRDNYPLPNMENLLQRVTRKIMLECRLY
jgi:hypothetical protein